MSKIGKHITRRKPLALFPSQEMKDSDVRQSQNPDICEYPALIVAEFRLIMDIGETWGSYEGHNRIFANENMMGKAFPQYWLLIKHLPKIHFLHFKTSEKIRADYVRWCFCMDSIFEGQRKAQKEYISASFHKSFPNYTKRSSKFFTTEFF